MRVETPSAVHEIADQREDAKNLEDCQGIYLLVVNKGFGFAKADRAFRFGKVAPGLESAEPVPPPCIRILAGKGQIIKGKTVEVKVIMNQGGPICSAKAKMEAACQWIKF